MNGTPIPYHLGDWEFVWLMIQGLAIGCFFTALPIAVAALLIALNRWLTRKLRTRRLWLQSR